jgi:catechol 2,3-dioxygenase-like lactoylglutathione lyase family enzyme
VSTPPPTLRIARPVRDLERSVAMYRAGLDLVELGRFADHDGFDGVMLGLPGSRWHLEFTACRHHPVAPAPTAEDLLVFYLPDEAAWRDGCARLRAAGFAEVEPFNPYWGVRGRSFACLDGYRTVLQHSDWPEG